MDPINYYYYIKKKASNSLFSAPNYCGEFDNSGSMVSVDETLMCSFQILYYSFCLYLMVCKSIVLFNLKMDILLFVVFVCRLYF